MVTKRGAGDVAGASGAVDTDGTAAIAGASGAVDTERTVVIAGASGAVDTDGTVVIAGASGAVDTDGTVTGTVGTHGPIDRPNPLLLHHPRKHPFQHPEPTDPKA